MQIIKHSPESCPLGNPKNLKIKMQWLESIEKLAAKHDVKVVGIWTDRWGHTTWTVFEAPDIDNFRKFELEPENIARLTFTSIENVIVTSANETLAFFKQWNDPTRAL